MAGINKSANHAPPPMYPAWFGDKIQETVVIASTINAATRQPREAPPGRKALAKTSSGEITAMKTRM